MLDMITFYFALLSTFYVLDRNTNSCCLGQISKNIMNFELQSHTHPSTLFSRFLPKEIEYKLSYVLRRSHALNMQKFPQGTETNIG